jgi:hypothetical protein
MVTPIIGNAFTLRFDTKIDTVLQPVAADGEGLMAELTERGFVAFRLQWEHWFEAQLAIEDDVAFICDAADELTAFVAGEHVHYVHLGDGELEITSTLSNGVVSIRADHTPHLDRRFHQRYEFTTTLHRYLTAWYAVVAELKKMT